MLQRFQRSWGLMREIEALSKKSTALAYSPRWQTTSFLEPSFERLSREAYTANAAVGACLRALSFAFPEPPPDVLNLDGDKEPDHPLQVLLDRPNSMMSHSELLTFIIVYLALGGNCYLYKVRGGGGQVVELWPYSDGHMSPVPGGKTWIKAYAYDIGDGEKQYIPPLDIVHLKWPLMDLAQPWMAQPPLRQASKEVDSDNELTRMLYGYLKNDATPRMVINIPAGTNWTDSEYEMFMARFMARHGGDNRGLPAVVEGANTISQMGLNIKDLDLTPLRGVPEARICAALGVPPEVAGLSVGLAHSTENNLYAADVRFTTRTLGPLWKLVAGELTQDLVPEFDPRMRVTVRYGISSIQALQRDEVEVWTQVIAGYDATLITKNEGRARMGLNRVADLKRDDPEGDVFKDGNMALGATESDEGSTPILGYHIEAGVVSRNEARAQLMLPPEDPQQSDRLRELKESLAVVQSAVNVGFPLDIALSLIGMDVALPEPIDVQPSPPQLPPPEKRYPYPLALKAKRDDSTEAITERMNETVRAALEAEYRAAAAL